MTKVEVSWDTAFAGWKESEFKTETEVREAIQSLRKDAGFEISEEDEDKLVRHWEYYTT